MTELTDIVSFTLANMTTRGRHPDIAPTIMVRCVKNNSSGLVWQSHPSLTPSGVNVYIDWVKGTWPYLKLLQDFVSLSPVFTHVFDLLALGAAAVMFHFGALGVYFGTFRLVAHGAVLGAHAGAVGVPGEETLPERVHEPAVVHASLPPVVVKEDVVIGVLVGIVRRVILRADGGRGHSRDQGKEEYAGRRNERVHPAPLHSYAFRERVSVVFMYSRKWCRLSLHI